MSLSRGERWGTPCGIALVVAFLACGEGDGTGSPDDPSVSDDAGVTPYEQYEPDPPAPPELPRMTPCPEGWREVSDPDIPGLVTCDPWPEGGPQDCAVDEAHFPGTPGCQRIGTACPEGDWAENLPVDGDIAYVKAGAPPGGRGTRENPFGRIQDGVGAVGDGGIVAISRGTFDEAVLLRRPVVLWGACVAETVIAPSTWSDERAAITVTERGGAMVRNLRISGARVGVFAESNTGALVLDSVAVDGAMYVGILVDRGGRLECHSLIVRHVGLVDSGYGIGIQGLGAATVELERVVVEHNFDQGVSAKQPGTSLVASSISIRDTERSATGQGTGLLIDSGATAAIDGLVVDGSRAQGIAVQDRGSLTATGIVARETDVSRITDAGCDGTGIGVAGGSTARISRATFTRNSTRALSVSGSDSSLTATDFVSHDDGAGAAGTGCSLGVGVFEGAHAILERGAVWRARGFGVIAKNGATLWATDLVVAATVLDDVDHLFQRAPGLVLAGAATGTIHRALFEDNGMSAVAVLQAGTEMVASDLAVSATDSDWDGFGYGLAVFDGGRANVTRMAVAGSRAAGVLVADPTTTARLEELVVEETWARDCVDDACPAQGFGIGIGVADEARAEISNFRISDSTLCGAALATGGALDLHDGEISRNPIGVNVQVDGFNIARLQNGVAFVDNGRNLDMEEMPLPDGSTVLGSEDEQAP